MPDFGPIHGELQGQVMATLWRLDAGTVEQVRSALPVRYRGAYTTVQTVLNRLAERGLVQRRKVGNAFEYRPRIAEDEYVSRSIAHTLAAASSDARRTALAKLVGRMDPTELSQLQALARTIGERRGEG
jgi:predicted transcriptional regulator